MTSSPTSSPVIDIQDVGFSYNGQTVLEHIDLQVLKGDFLAMIGPNGGGKTTLLKMMLGLLSPQIGSIRVFGKPPKKVSHRTGYVPQDVDINLHFPVSVLDVVLMGKLAPGGRRNGFSRQDRATARKALEKLDMGAYSSRRIGDLSGGQRQRVFVARALAAEPELLFLDEPTASIDTKGQRQFYSLLSELNAHLTIVLVSHDLMVLSGYVKSVACVNQHLHYHDQGEITGEMIEEIYHCGGEEECPVGLIADGLPHTILAKH